MSEKVTCYVCPRLCELGPGQTGFCRARTNKDGDIVSNHEGKISAGCFDPVEKKSLYHFHPGKELLSLGGWGCNLNCFYCQNYSISQHDYEPHKAYPMSGQDILTRLQSRPEKAIGVSFTYNEPMVNYEYMLGISTIMRQNHHLVAVSTNGCITPEYSQILLACADALTVSFRGFSVDSCEAVCGFGGAYQYAQDVVEKALERGVHTEVTYIVIPDLTSVGEIGQFYKWVKSLGVPVPVHLLGYVPYNRGLRPATTLDELKETWMCSLPYELPFVYAENCQNDVDLHTTRCPKCSSKLIERDDVELLHIYLRDDNTCPTCGSTLSPLVR
jgi:pyruvate formate lyase activating enzyme